MDQRARPRLSFSRLAAAIALVLGATDVAAQIPFGLDAGTSDALTEHGFVTFQSRTPPVDSIDKPEAPLSHHRGDLRNHAFLRAADNEAHGLLPDHRLDYEALGAGATQAVVLRGQIERGFDWLHLEGAKEQGAGAVTRVFRAQGVVRGSLLASFAAAGISIAAANEALRAFEQEIDLRRAIRGGDRFAVLIERRFAANGRRVGEDRIVWAELRLYDRRVLAIHRFRSEGGAEQFWLADGLSVIRAPLKAPADVNLMSSPFGKREGPILGKRDAMHTGIDYALGPGTAVPSAAAGIVKAAEPNGGYGKWVLIEHGQGLATAYAHLDSFAPGIVPGARVAQGDVIGFTGDTGLSTGPHLHYEVLVDGEAVDPMTHAASVRDMLRGADLERFHAEIGRLLQDYAGTAPIAQLSIR